jgi:phosphoribosylformimino-5-aminoimidazole carboxamide ribotide isomerase/imidazole glycerol phosphate synthase glutamine amidotransferase subunit
VGVAATITAERAEIQAADGLILPGVGAFPKAMERIRERGLDELIAERRDADTPILGICLGLQLLFDSTTELGGAAGLGLLPGEVAELDAPGLKIPHIGWSPVRWEKESRLTDGIESGTPFYLVHSFAPQPAAGDVLGTAVYGARFACAAERDNVFGVQFECRRPAAALQLCRGLRGRPCVILYPAIDIRGGQAVRLLQGDYERETAYDADPVDAAIRWAEEGARFLHVVDLDGAKAGRPRNLEAVRRIAEAVDCPIQVGGGLRDAESVAAVLEAGAERVVIGTAALRDPEFLEGMLEKHGRRVVVSVDARNGRVALAGWTEAGEEGVVETVLELSSKGVARFLFTPIEVDGTMEGPGIGELSRVVAATPAEVIYSGGVGSLDDLEQLNYWAGQWRASNLEGVIVGRALYERKFTVAQAIAALAGK